MAGIVQFDNVGLRYGTGAEILAGLSFTLLPGSFHFLTGASGAGKTSLINLITLAQRPSRGIVSLFGEDAASLPRKRLPSLRRRIGVVYQDFRLVSQLSAFDNVALPLRISGMAEREIAPRVEELLDWVGLAPRAGARPATLSGGEQQRVAIARAVANAPLVLLADEPTGNLDERTGAAVFGLISDLRRKRNLTAVLVTHNQQFARVCDRILRLEAGALR